MVKNVLFVLAVVCMIPNMFIAESAIDKNVQHQDVSPPSIFFIIDNSVSMMTNPGNDSWGYRFSVAKALIDTLHTIFDSVEIGLAVFQQHLYFDPVDDPIFVQTPGYDTGAYIPLLTLDSSYAPSGELGYQILHGYLDCDTIGTGSSVYVDMVYTPSSLVIGKSTNINAAFAAAKHAMQTAKYNKDKQFIFFFSDGEATYPNNNETQFLEDVSEGVPTTYTIYFTNDNMVPWQIDSLTKVIQSNGYSTMNDSSKYYAVDLVMTDLNEFILKNIFPDLFNKKIPKLISCPSPTYERRPTLTWNKPLEPGTQYTIQVAATPDFSSSVINVAVADTFYACTVDLPYGTIYWRVKTDISTWSLVSSFHILNDMVPVIIPHQSPTSNVTPTLKWHPSQGGATTYTIQISTSITFSTNLVETPLTDTFFTCQAPLPYDTIYWHVKGDSSEYSPTSSFYIDSTITAAHHNNDPSYYGFSCTPTLNNLRITVPDAAGRITEVTVFDTKGRVTAVLYKNRTAQNEIVWNYCDNAVKKIGAGLYLVSITCGEKKFIYKVPLSR